jgi:hypothetical protein
MPCRTNFKWTPSARGRLTRMTNLGHTAKEIAAALGTTKSSVDAARYDFRTLRKTRRIEMEPLVERYMREYGVSRSAVISMGLDRLPKMGEEARAFLLRDIDQYGTQPKLKSLAPVKLKSLSVPKVRRPVELPKAAKGVRRTARMLELMEKLNRLGRQAA